MRIANGISADGGFWGGEKLKGSLLKGNFPNALGIFSGYFNLKRLFQIFGLLE